MEPADVARWLFECALRPLPDWVRSVEYTLNVNADEQLTGGLVVHPVDGWWEGLGERS